MVFLTNNLEWAASTVADLYRCRWKIESFFKELKQTVQLADFLGYSANAVKWQVWIALLVHLLLRFQAWRSRWAHSFTRLFTYVVPPCGLSAICIACSKAVDQPTWGLPWRLGAP